MMYVSACDSRGCPQPPDFHKKWPKTVRKPQKFANVIGPLGLIHIQDFLGVNYCVNFSVHAVAKMGI